MPEPSDKPRHPKPKTRAEKLAAALRENLKRRKAQTRARAAGQPGAPGAAPSSRKDAEKPD